MERDMSKESKDVNGKNSTAKQEDATKGLVISHSASPKGKLQAAKSSLGDVARRIIDPVGPVPTSRRPTRISTKYPIRRVSSAPHVPLNYEVGSDFEISTMSVPNSAPPQTSKQPTKEEAACAAATPARHSASARLQKAPRRQEESHDYDQMDMNDEVPQPAATGVAPIVAKQDRTTGSDDNKLFFVLNENDELFIYGTMELQLLYGKISVFGHVITTSNKIYKMYVPKGTSQFSIKNICSDQMTIKTRHALRRNGLGMHQLTNIRGGESVILCRNISNDALHNAFRTYFPRLRFPGIPEGVWCQLRDKSELSLDTDQRYVMGVPRAWDAIALALMDSSRVFFAGDKGTGKSTMLRYFVNHLLNRFPAVNVIDLDPDQSEFTVSGCISATVVTEPLFGPSYTHLKTPNICVPVCLLDGCLPDDGYAPKVRYLVARSEVELERAPTLINYMGYTRLNAIKLVARAITITKPTVLIQLQQTLGGNNYKCTLNAGNVKSILQRYNLAYPTDLYYKVHVLNTAVTCQPKETHGFQMTPKENRELSVIAYFSQLFSANVKYLLHPDIKAIRVSYSNCVTLLYHDKLTTPDVVNGELVMLCENVTAEVPTFRCHGWGIVKYVNVTDEFLYLLTPVNPDELNLRQVKYLMMGTIQMPLTFHTKCNGYEEELPIPYVSRVEAVPLNLPLRFELHDHLAEDE